MKSLRRWQSIVIAVTINIFMRPAQYDRLSQQQLSILLKLTHWHFSRHTVDIYNLRRHRPKTL